MNPILWIMLHMVEIHPEYMILQQHELISDHRLVDEYILRYDEKKKTTINNICIVDVII